MIPLWHAAVIYGAIIASSAYCQLRSGRDGFRRGLRRGVEEGWDAGYTCAARAIQAQAATHGITIVFAKDAPAEKAN